MKLLALFLALLFAVVQVRWGDISHAGGLHVRVCRLGLGRERWPTVGRAEVSRDAHD